MKSYSEYVLEAALWYVDHGVKVFQVDTYTKRPFEGGGFYNATLDKQKVKDWFDVRPNTGLAVPTGMMNGFFVLDVDERNGGFNTLKAMLEEHSPLPVGPTVFTQNGGLHYYFKYPQFELKTTKIPGGIDIKSDGGYVLVPPSASGNSRRYAWEPGKDLGKLELPEAPKWLFEFLKREKTRQDDAWTLDGLVYPEGTRESNLLRLMGWLIHRGASGEAIRSFVAAENEARCRPPLSSKELARLVDAATSRYKTDPEEALGVMPVSLIPKGWGKPHSLSGVLHASAGHVDELIEGIIGKGTVTILAAAWKSGKTLLTYQLILDALQGKPVWGAFPVSKPLKILMLQFEMPVAEDERRFRRLSIGSKITVQEFLSMVGNNYIHFSRPGTYLNTQEQTQEFRRYVLAENFDLVIIDSLTACFAGQDLNDNSIARMLFSQAFTQITTAGKSVLILHHKRKRSQIPGVDDNKGAVLGAQAWGAAADRTFSLDNVAPTLGEPFAPGEFRVRLEVLGSWAPTDLHGLTVVIRDEGDGTVLEPVNDSPQVTDTRLEDCIRDLADIVVKEPGITQGKFHNALTVMGYSRNTRRHAQELAIAREWISSGTQEFGKVKPFYRGPKYLK